MLILMIDIFSTIAENILNISLHVIIKMKDMDVDMGFPSTNYNQLEVIKITPNKEAQY